MDAVQYVCTVLTCHSSVISIAFFAICINILGFNLNIYVCVYIYIYNQWNSFSITIYFQINLSFFHAMF